VKRIPVFFDFSLEVFPLLIILFRVGKLRGCLDFPHSLKQWLLSWHLLLMIFINITFYFTTVVIILLKHIETVLVSKTDSLSILVNIFVGDTILKMLDFMIPVELIYVNPIAGNSILFFISLTDRSELTFGLINKLQCWGYR
jgi:hypothetical protein